MEAYLHACRQRLRTASSYTVPSNVGSRQPFWGCPGSLRWHYANGYCFPVGRYGRPCQLCRVISCGVSKAILQNLIPSWRRTTRWMAGDEKVWQEHVSCKDGVMDR